MCDVVCECGSVLGVDKVDEGAPDPHVPRVAQYLGDGFSGEHYHAWKGGETCFDPSLEFGELYFL